MTAIKEFKRRLEQYGVANIRTDESTNKVYVYASVGGLGIPVDCYNGLDVALIESIGMDSLSETHRLYDDTAHHILIFKIE